MPTFIIRSQGFFYTDEYFAPGDVFKQVVKKTYPTKQAAEKARAALVRKWVRSDSIGNYVFDDQSAVAAVWAYLRKEWPDAFEGVQWLHDVEIPRDATDAQVDEIVQRMGVTFAQVFEVEEGDIKDEGDEDGSDEGDEDGDGSEEEDDEDEDEGDEDGDDLHYGPES
jgi:hypothetical protein